VWSTELYIVAVWILCKRSGRIIALGLHTSHMRRFAFRLRPRLLHIGGLSNRGLKAIIHELKTEPLDLEFACDSRVDRVFREKCNALCHVIEMPLDNPPGIFSWALLDPNKMLCEVVQQSKILTGLFKDAAARCPPTMANPWSLVVGFDEFTPGNKLKIDNARKCMNLSFSFRELGNHALSSELAWFTPVCVRHQQIQLCKGGWPNFLREYLLLQLLGSSGLATSGVPLVLDGEVLLVFAKLKNILSDGDGLRMAFDWRGHGSLKPCFKHINVFRKDPSLVTDACHLQLPIRRPQFEHDTGSKH
jgi:hypothetical protein